MAYRRKIIDRRTREGKALGRQVDAFQGFLFLLFLAVAAVGGLVHSLSGPSEGGSSVVTPAQAAEAGSAPPPRTPQVRQRGRQDAGYAPLGADSAAGPTAPTAMAMSSVPLQPAPPDAPAAIPRPSVPWRHVTANGTRWNLRHVSGTALLLVIDIGSDRTANVSVAPAFESLELAAMNVRVDYLRETITHYYPLQTADYGFERDGSIRRLP